MDRISLGLPFLRTTRDTNLLIYSQTQNPVIKSLYVHQEMLNAPHTTPNCCRHKSGNVTTDSSWFVLNRPTPPHSPNLLSTMPFTNSLIKQKNAAKRARKLRNREHQEAVAASAAATSASASTIATIAAASATPTAPSHPIQSVTPSSKKSPDPHKRCAVSTHLLPSKRITRSASKRVLISPAVDTPSPDKKSSSTTKSRRKGITKKAGARTRRNIRLLDRTSRPPQLFIAEPAVCFKRHDNQLSALRAHSSMPFVAEIISSEWDCHTAFP